VPLPPFRTLIPSCLFLLAAGPGGFFDSTQAASATISGSDRPSTPPGDACFTNEIRLNDSASDDGNLSFDGAREYTWDAERGDQIGSLLDGGEAGARRASHATTRMASQHRLLEIKTRAGFETVGAIFPSFRQQMEYDDLGRRIRSRLYHRINLVEHLVRDDVFVYDGWKLITTLSGQSGDVLQRFAWGLDLSHTVGGAGNVSGLLVFEDPALGQSHFPRFDGNGNVVGLIAATDPTGAPVGTPNAGEVSATYEYDPFGNALGATGHAAARNPFRFSTAYQDPVTKFSYYGYRFYDPGHGRWLNRDPIAEAGGLNLYGFVGNDPVNAVDVLGMATISDYESIVSEMQSESIGEHEKQLRGEHCPPSGRGQLPLPRSSGPPPALPHRDRRSSGKN
jgi:RHS repeat-associated protein